MPAGRAIALGSLTIVLATLVAGMAWPRLQAAVRFIPVDAAVARFHETGERPGEQMDALLARGQSALEQLDHYRFHEGLSFLYYLQALDAVPGSPEQRQALQASLSEARETLRQAPAKPATWLRVARIEAALGVPVGQIAGSLSMSMLTGRVEPGLLVPRLELGYRYLGQLDADTRALLLDQTALAWAVDRRGVINSASQGRLDIGAMRQLLAPTRSGLLNEMEASLEAPAG
ncbi:hypothetical protein F3N42_01555 [Marinihelvus fidelis]|uniref:Uncharacterized protein n=1 Tax=Marinihelvus fidelis TaxID=2613842 RepID=A0A5N0TDJ5_9GAMM|nr:hypothetical protein [Marinihelvus fidelis]KAA9133075.1 hypothetical protein F3N42_01555 [Marinihelvus fidelis]